MKNSSHRPITPEIIITTLALCWGAAPTVVAAPGDLSVSGDVTAQSFTGDGSGLTNLPTNEVYASTIVVSPLGSDDQNGQALVDALNSIPDPRDVGNPILVRVEPGTYDVSNTGVTSIEIEDYVDLEGSGIGVTTIQGDQSTLMNVDGISELRHLTVKNIKADTYAYAIRVDNGGRPTFSHVAIHSDSGKSHSSNAIDVGGGAHPLIQDSLLSAAGDSYINTLSVGGDASPHIRRSVIETECVSDCNAINVQDAYLRLEDSVLESADTGLFTYDGGSTINYDLYVDHSSIIGSSNAIDIIGSNIDIFVGASKIGGNVGSFSNLTCVQSYNGSYQELDSQCQ